MSRIGDRLRELVPADRGEQRKLALSIGMRPATLNKILKGETQEPGFETIARIASGLKVSLDVVYGGELPSAKPIGGDFLSATDRRRLRDFGRWLTARFSGDAGAIAAAADVADFPAKTLPEPTRGFTVQLSDFNDSGATDYPRVFHGWEEEDRADGGADKNMPTLWLNSKEVRSAEKLTVRVRDNSVAPYFEGCKLLIDATRQDPSLLDDGEIAVAYSDDAGTFVGIVGREKGRVILATDKGDRITIGERGYSLMGPVADAWIPKQRRKKGGIA